MPYLPIDPHARRPQLRGGDPRQQPVRQGRRRLHHEVRHGLDLPRRLQIEFSSVIQKLTETSGTEISADQIWDSFGSTYLKPTGPVALDRSPDRHHAPETGETTIEATLKLDGPSAWSRAGATAPSRRSWTRSRATPAWPSRSLDYSEHALGEGADARAAAYVEARIGGKTRWGVGLDASIVTASLRAVVSAVNRV